MYLVVEKILDMENRITEYTIKALNALIGIECFYERRLDIKAVSEILGHASAFVTISVTNFVTKRPQDKKMVNQRSVDFTQDNTRQNKIKFSSSRENA